MRRRGPNAEHAEGLKQVLSQRLTEDLCTGSTPFANEAFVQRAGLLQSSGRKRPAESGSAGAAPGEDCAGESDSEGTSDGSGASCQARKSEKRAKKKAKKDKRARKEEKREKKSKNNKQEKKHKKQS